MNYKRVLPTALVVLAISALTAQACLIKGYVSCPNGISAAGIEITLTRTSDDGLGIDVTWAYTDATGYFEVPVGVAYKFTNCVTVSTLPAGLAVVGDVCKIVDVTDIGEGVVYEVNWELAGPACEEGCARVTGGGKQLEPLTYPAVESVTHGGQVGAPVGVETLFSPDSPCIRGEWQHVRHYGPGVTGNFHARSFDSLMTACLDAGYGPGALVGELCNPGDRVSGPEPRKAPANKITFSGVGDYALEKGKREVRSVLFRVDIEDRSEPGNSKKASEDPADRYRIRIWVLTEAELAKLVTAGDRLLDMRLAIAATPMSVVTRDGADVPNGTAVFGIRAPDIDDGGELNDGNHQIHPCIKDCP